MSSTALRPPPGCVHGGERQQWWVFTSWAQHGEGTGAHGTSAGVADAAAGTGTCPQRKPQCHVRLRDHIAPTEDSET